MTRQQLSHSAAALLILALLAATPVLADTFRDRLDSSVVIGGEIFEPGSVQLIPIPSENLHAVVLNSRPVALVFRHAADRCPARARAAGLLFRSDEEGRLHLVGIRWEEPGTGNYEERLFRVAAVAEGITSVAMLEQELPARPRRLLR